VTSSPFRSSIITKNINKPNQRPLHSSSSSTNTNFTNTYLRQTLLKSEIKRPLIQLPSPGNSLGEIPFTNIRFLQELGEGKTNYKITIYFLLFHFRRIWTNLQR
jgi:hypothetical protein